MFNFKNNIAWKNEVKRVIGDTDETKNYIEYIDGVRELVNIKAIAKMLGYGLCTLIESEVKYIVAILLSIALITTTNDESFTIIKIVAIITMAIIIVKIVYGIGTAITFCIRKKDIINCTNENTNVELTEESFKKPDEEFIKYLHKTNDGGKHNWAIKLYEFCCKANKAAVYLDEFEGITEFIANELDQYTKEVLTSEDFEDFTFSIYYSKKFFEDLFSASESDIPSCFHYYTVAEICIKILKLEGWLDSTEKYDELIANNKWYRKLYFHNLEDINDFFNLNDWYWNWMNGMKYAFESREADKGESLYVLTIIGILLRAKREIEASLKKD